MLECQHVFCLSCLEKYIGARSERDRFPCPLCREECVIPGGQAKALKKTFFHETLRDIIKAGSSAASQARLVDACSVETCEKKAVKFCRNDCGYLCCEHEKQHAMFAKQHKLVDVSLAGKTAILSYPPCEFHPHQVLDVFCETCQNPICVTCHTLKHQQHQCCELQAKVAEYKQNIQKLVQTAGEDVKSVKKIIIQSDKQAKIAIVEISKMETDVNKVFDEIAKMVDKKRKQLLDELRKAKIKSSTKHTEIKGEQEETW